MKIELTNEEITQMVIDWIAGKFPSLHEDWFDFGEVIVEPGKISVQIDYDPTA